MKIIITGISGLLGYALWKEAARRRHHCIGIYGRFPIKPINPDSQQTLSMDLTNADLIERLILDEFPDAVIHAAAISNPESVDKNPKLSENINVRLPKKIAQLCHQIGARFFHYSTDMVFNGQENHSYKSTDLPDPTTLYAKQKVAAEKLILAVAATEANILRIPILSGNSPQGNRSIHERILHKISSGIPPKLYTNEIRQPISADNVAQLTIELLERTPPLSGIFHWAGCENHSRYNMGIRIMQHFGLSENEIRPNKITKDNLRKPRFLKLDSNLLQSKVRIRPDPFSVQLSHLSIPRSLFKWYREIQ